jgi:hypothetical protein
LADEQKEMTLLSEVIWNTCLSYWAKGAGI